jgi:hypothetical protein
VLGQAPAAGPPARVILAPGGPALEVADESCPYAPHATPSSLSLCYKFAQEQCFTPQRFGAAFASMTTCGLIY